MEKLYKDHAWNINQATQWFKLIGHPKYPRALEYHQAHLKIAKTINDTFKKIYR